MRNKETQQESPAAPKVVGPTWPKGSIALGCALPYREDGQWIQAGKWWTLARSTRLEAWWYCPMLAYAVRDILESNAQRRNAKALAWIMARGRAEALSNSLGLIDRSAARSLLAHGLGKQTPTHAQLVGAESLSGLWAEASARLARNLGMEQVGPDEAPTVLASARSLLRLDRDGLLPRSLAAPPDLEPPAGYRERPSMTDRLEQAAQTAKELF
jgi:hypothetical protein